MIQRHSFRHLPCTVCKCIWYAHYTCGARKLCLGLSWDSLHLIFAIHSCLRVWYSTTSICVCVCIDCKLQCSHTFHEPIPTRNHAADSIFLILVASHSRASERAFSISFARCCICFSFNEMCVCCYAKLGKKKHEKYFTPKTRTLLSNR